MNSIYLTIFGLIFLILLVIVYFSKKRVNYIENKVYSFLIISSLIGTIIEVISYILVVNGINGNSLLYAIVMKLLFENFFIWMSLFLLYYILIALKSKEHNVKKIINMYIISVILITLIVTFLPLNVIDTNGMLLPKGPAVDILYLLYGLCFLIIIFILLKNLKNIRNKRYVPLIIILIVFSFVVVMQNINPEIILLSPSSAFVTFLMYFTIENPDVKMIEQLNVAREQADKANHAKTEFLSNMSHEIRTPLNAIVGFSNILLEDEDVPEKSKDEIKDIVMASDNLLEIVNGILDISKIEANKIEIVNNEYSIKKVLDDLVALTKGRIAEKPLEFKVNIDETIPPVLYGDSQRIKQICVNILTNAVKYTKEGWIELKVSHIKIDNICRLIISVEDTGIGIKEGNIDKLFTKFERLDLNDNVTIEGTGLGLAITKKLVDLMGGKIVVQSVFGKGSRFTVSLDQRIVENPTISLEDIPDAKSEEIKVEGKKVLIVDDNKINIKVAERLLDNYSVLHDSCESGLDCINKIKEGNKYDLILMDDMMPKMSGTETFHELEKIPGFNIPVIALTANALTGMKEKYLSEGFSDYLAKPINKDELNRIINTFLNQE